MAVTLSARILNYIAVSAFLTGYTVVFTLYVERGPVRPVLSLSSSARHEETLRK